MRTLRQGTFVLALLLGILLFSQLFSAEARHVQPLQVMEMAPGVLQVGDTVTLRVNAEDDAVTVLYLNERVTNRKTGSGEMNFRAQLPFALQQVRLVRTTGSIVEEAVGVIPVGLEGYEEHQGESVLLVPTAKLDSQLRMQLSTEPVFSSTELDVIARGLESASPSQTVSALGTMGSPLKGARVFSRTGAVSGTADGAGLQSLLSNPYLKRLEYDIPVHAMLADSVPLVNASLVWGAFNNSLGNITGKNVTIAIIDTGIDYTHPDLGGCLGATCKVRPGYDYVNNDADPMDDNGHGTHVAGIAAANGSARGVAPDATLIAYKVLDSTGEGKASDVIAAIENASAAGYDIISLSLGGQGNADDAMSTAVDNAVAAGSVVVVAAGNFGPSASTIGSPGTARLAITVGNTDKNDTMRDSSSRGPNPSTLDIKPELTAPGVDISSTALGGGNTSYNGTSMSAPHVSGAAALLLQMQPTLSPARVKAALVGTSRDLGYNLTTQGAGRLDAYAAVNVSFIATPALLSLGTQSNRLSNITALFNLTELSNQTYNVTLTAGLRTGNGNVSLSITQVRLTDSNTSENVQLFINLTTMPNGIYSGFINATSTNPATSIRIPFWVQVAGWRTKTLETVTDVGGGALYGTKIGDADNDGYNEMTLPVDSINQGWVRVAKYNPNGTWNLTSTPIKGDYGGVGTHGIGDVDNDGTNEIAEGLWELRVGYDYWNGTGWDYFEIDSNLSGDGASDAGIRELVIADGDNNGANDIVVVSYVNSGNAKLYLINYTNNSWNYTVIDTCGCQDPGHLAVGDVNNDSLNDVVEWDSISGDLNAFLFYNDSKTWNKTQMDVHTTLWLYAYEVYDIDEDGETEFILGGGTDAINGIIFIYHFEGNNTWSRTNISNIGTGSIEDIVFADIDNDGEDEMVVSPGDGSSQQFYLYELDNGVYTQYTLRDDISYLRKFDIGDATGDGLNNLGFAEEFSGNGDWFILYAIAPPHLTQLSLNDSNVTQSDSPGISVAVQDSDPLSSVMLYWSANGASWNSTTMTT